MSERRSQQEYETHIAPVQEFYFDPERGVFVIGEKKKKKEQSPQDLGDIFQFNYDFRDNDYNFRKASSLIKKHSLGLSPMFTLVEFPGLRNWIADSSSSQKTQIAEKVLETMEKVYEDLNPNAIVKLPKNQRGGVFGFNANLRADGSFILSTIGNCACMGATPDPITISYDHIRFNHLDKALPLEYELHNTDTPAQRLSLYAGAGTIAWLEKQSRSVDVEE